MNYARALTIAFLLSQASYAFAEGGACPPGYYPLNTPGVSGCAPIPGYSSSTGPSQGSDPQFRWSKTWGAISADGVSGTLGTVVGMATEQQAKYAALTKCRDSGGNACKVDLTFHNQCAVMILGSRKYTTASAATIEEATQLGMTTCQSGDIDCRVYYAECSIPVRID